MWFNHLVSLLYQVLLHLLMAQRSFFAYYRTVSIKNL